MANDPVEKDSAEPAAAEPAQMIPKDKYDDLLDRLNNYEATLKTLQSESSRPQQSSNQQQVQQVVQATQGAVDDAVTSIARQLGGADVSEVRQWANFIQPFFERMAQPYVQAMAGLADKMDNLEARAEIPDYGKFTTEVDQERSSRLSRGEYLSRKEAYHLARSRNLPRLIEEERAKLMDEMKSQVSQATQATETTASIAKAGPSPSKNTALSRDDFNKLSLEEKEKLLENVTF